MGETALVRVQRVSRKFGEHLVLKEISLDIAPGAIVGLLGPSGSGKTTLVKMVAGSDRPDGGTVHVDGALMPDIKMLSRIGYMAQSDALYGELTARDNLEYFGALYELRGTPLRQRIAKVIELVDLGQHLDRPVQLFSGGMKRRLSLACALLHEPSILILDEPTVGIDPVLRIAIWDELRRLAKGGTSLLVTTHVMDEVERCDSVVMIRDGIVIAADSPAALKKSYGVATIEEVFVRCSRPAEAA
jgi:ABC-2 type transport system ATP-binding protein